MPRSVSEFLEDIPEDQNESDITAIESFISNYRSTLIPSWRNLISSIFPENFIDTTLRFQKKKDLFSTFVGIYQGTTKGSKGALYAPNNFFIKLKRAVESEPHKILVYVEMFHGKKGHANAILINNEAKTVDVYEPNGSQYQDFMDSSFVLAKFIAKYLKDRGFGNYLPQTAYVSCPRIGAQSLEALGYQMKMEGRGKKPKKSGHGFCAVWSLMYIHYHLLNPMADNQEIQQAMLGDKNPINLERKAMRYTELILNYVAGLDAPKFVPQERRKRRCMAFVRKASSNPDSLIDKENPLEDGRKVSKNEIQTIAEECKRIIEGTEEDEEEEDQFNEYGEEEEELGTDVFQYDAPDAAKCLRSIASVKKYETEFKFDKGDFDPQALLSQLTFQSPKAVALLDKIKQLDAQDMETHGRKFKHFIFSDLKQEGAKFLVGALNASGFKPCIKAVKESGKKSLTLRLLSNEEIERENGLGDNFVYLLSSSVFETSFTVDLKKSVLKLFNSRPNNVYGDLARIILLDSGYKEGIDLFDVKYVHIFEPPTTKANLRQTIGRATRFCGQAGLPFDPREGWKLSVFLYDIEFERAVEETLKIKKGEDIVKRYILSDHRVAELEAQLDDLCLEVSVDKDLNQYIHQFVVEEAVVEDLVDKEEEVNRMINPVIEVTERQEVVDFVPVVKKLKIKCSASRGKCGQTRSTKAVPLSTAFFYILAFGLGYVMPGKAKFGNREVRNFLCELLSSANFCEEMNKVLEDPIKFIVENKDEYVTAFKSGRGAFSNIKSSVRRQMALILHKALENSIVDEMMSKPPSSKKIRSRKEGSEFIVPEVPDIDEELPTPEPPTGKLSHEELQNYIRENYSHCMWPKPKMENQCLTTPSVGGDSGPKIVNFTPSQEFIRTYFTPSNPYKGMLIQHGVGCGKTCTAIATATSSFDSQGYTILWVTRSSLKSDLYKNMFDLVCNAHIKEMLLAGKTIPKDKAARTRLLGKAWAIQPMSYRQFSNLVEGKNEIYQKLVKLNGEEDPLKKTFIIIDEAHKLYGGDDISGTEKPNMEAFHQALMNSYQVSGQESARVMLMTATPYTNDPMEFFKIVNLMKEPEEQFPETFDAFRREYLDKNGKFTEEGRKRIMDQLAGQISYLSRQNDARQFARIHTHQLTVNQRKVSRDEARRQVERLREIVARLGHKEMFLQAKVDAENKRKYGRSKAAIAMKKSIVEDLEKRVEEVHAETLRRMAEVETFKAIAKEETKADVDYLDDFKKRCFKKITVIKKEKTKRLGKKKAVNKTEEKEEIEIEDVDEREEESGSENESESENETESESDDE